MADSGKQMDRWRGWSKTASARARRKEEQRSAVPRVVTLPDRRSTVELGAEVLSLRRGGHSEGISADNLMIERMLQRALGPDKRLRDYVDLYELANAEQEAAEAAPRELSPYRRKKLVGLLAESLRKWERVSSDLIASGLAEVAEDGAIRPVHRFEVQVPE